MTSDTKIGLLLGLVFIFVIAFLINGVPGVPMGRVTNELTHNMAYSGVDTPRIGENVRLANRQMSPPRSKSMPQNSAAFRSRESLPINDTSTIRSIAPIPKDLARHAEAVISEKRAQREAEEAAKTLTLADVTLPRQPRTYIVRSGDILDTIAAKFYGNTQGKVQETRDRLFAANRHHLRSPDELKIGQELIIPVLDLTPPESLRNVTKQVDSIGKPQARDRQKSHKPVRRWYQVRDGDSLWKIAAVSLGDGNRYGDIARLNRSLLGDADQVHPGMRLRLPPQ